MYDLYPSRIETAPKWIKRQDPVVYDQRSDFSGLPKHDIRSYENDGYLILDSFFSSEEVSSLNNAIDQLINVPSLLGRDEFIKEPDNPNMIRSIFAPNTFSEVFNKLVEDSRIKGMANFILDDQTYVHQARINVKQAFIGKEFDWHSDFETWHVEDGMPRMRALSCMIALTENTGYNGPLLVMPGSHREFISCVGETPDNHYMDSLRRQQYGVPDNESLTELYNQFGIREITCSPGSLILFDCNLMHGSNGNITPLARRNIFIIYNAETNRLVDPFGDTEPRPDFIAQRPASSVKK